MFLVYVKVSSPCYSIHYCHLLFTTPKATVGAGQGTVWEQFLSQGSVHCQRPGRCTLERLEGENYFEEPWKKRFMVLRTVHLNHWKSN